MYDPLLMISPLDGRYHKKLSHLQQDANEFSLIKNRVLIEIAWFKALAKTPDIPNLPPLSNGDLEFLDQIIKNFNLSEARKIKTLEQQTNHDVKAVEYYLAQQFKQSTTLTPYIEFIHFACTSEDINNLAHGLMTKALVHNHLIQQIESLMTELLNCKTTYAAQPLLARTHGQTASPTTVGKEFAIFYARLQKQLHTLKNIPLLGKMNGATGNFNAHTVAYPELDWVAFSCEFIQSLGLTPNLFTTQIEPHDYLAEVFHCIERINTILMDYARDIWGYISLGYFKQKVLDQEVGSSTMPHKVNPIDFENAEGNLGISNAILHHMAQKLPISRWQRDLSDSTVLRNIGVGIAYADLGVQALCQGTKKLSMNVNNISADLAQAWEVLAEPLQTLMRKEQLANAYDTIKALTRGKPLEQTEYLQLLDQLPLSQEAKTQLAKLSPETYVGIAEKLATLDK